MIQSDLLEHQRAQQQLQQQQLQQQQQQQPPQQSIQQPPPQQQQASLTPNSLQQQSTLPQPQAPANQPNLAAVVGAHQQKHQLQQLQGLTSAAPAAASPSPVPTAVSSQTPSLATADAGGVATLVGPGRSISQGISLPPTAPVAVRSTVSGGQSVGVPDGEAKTTGVAAVQPRPILPAPAQGTQGINMAGLNMLAAVGARQQQQLQQQQQQASASTQPAQAKVLACAYAIF